MRKLTDPQYSTSIHRTFSAMKNALFQLLAAGKTDQALSALQNAADLDKDEQNMIRMLAARYAENERGLHTGTIAQELYNLERNRINAGVLAVVERLEGESKIHTTQTHNKSKKNHWAKIGGVIVVAIGLLAGIAEISGFSLRDLFGKKEVPETATQTPEKPGDKDTLVVENPNVPVVKETPASKQKTAPPNHFESKDQSKQINLPGNKGPIHINQ